MYKNYLKTALRNFWKNRTFSFINILGLALGMACSLLIMLWVHDERSMDAYHKNNDLLYRIYERQYYDGKIEAGYYTPGQLPDEMKKVLPEVQYSTGLAWDNENAFQVGDKILRVKGNHAGEDFFKMFSIPLIQGNAATALKSPTNIAISRKMAVDLFGSPEAAINKTVRFENRKDFQVTGVFENLPVSSTFQFHFLLSWQQFLEENGWAKEWGNNGPATYLMLRKDANPQAFRKKITKFLDAYNKEQDATFRIELGIQQFSDVYLNSNFKNGEITGGRVEYVRLFSIVAIFILLIACINFMNLTTARSIKRAKEIGIRKVVGAVRVALMRQFIGEAILLSFFAVVIAFGIIILMLPTFNGLTSKFISIPFSNLYFWIILLTLTLVTGVFSGLYPALFLSGFNPVRAFKGAARFSSGAVWFRKGLVVFQFALSTILIIGTIVISKQVDYVQSTNLGYDRENLISIPLEGDLTAKYKLFKESAQRLPGIKSVSRISQSPTQIENGTGGVEWEGKDPSSKPMFTQAAVGFDFVKTMDLKLLKGRDFGETFGTDTAAYIVNETALSRFGYKDPIGKPLTFWGKKGTIIGVLKDFHFNSLHVPINPIVIRLGENDGYGGILVRTAPGKTKEVLKGLEDICRQLNPKFPFTYYFSDEEYAKLYKSEQVISKLSNYFAFLAIFISCLGLLGLAIFTAEQRRKEIGIRKVLGASISSVFGLLSRDFLILVGIALVIASPVAWWMMSNWLQDYSYRTPISWWIFAVAGVAAIAIALLTVSFQAIRAALANPVKSLRSE